jgi:hypothetical protein
VDLRFVAE